MISKDLAIKVENIGKIYRIGLKEDMHDSFGSALFHFMKSPLNNYRKYRSLYKFHDINKANGNIAEGGNLDIIWALSDISFEVKKGEVLGIIGRNGAGKSTLLKILCKITPPTNGRAEIRGRVSSLLEVGTGFHQELTGRENVYLNGTVLGMTKKEVDRKFDDIVEFSGVEKFIDTPVKRYSSGMKVRLAFSVAAHLEPEILLIDEVLAVGDQNFQRKCLNKMEEVGKHGRTVIFVSHNMPAVTRLCPRTILLDEGALVADGPSHQIVREYLNSDFHTPGERYWSDLATAPGGEIARLNGVRVITQNGEIVDTADIRKTVCIQMEYQVLRSGYVLSSVFDFYNDKGIHMFSSVDLDPAWRKRSRPPGAYTSTVFIPGNFLSEGAVFVHCGLFTLQPYRARQFSEKDVVSFQVIDSVEGDSARGDWTDSWGGAVRPLLQWDTKLVST
jgi:lipopolysaccharide transport system ATP-binding protein